MKFYVCNEMQKLRNKLDENKIRWEDCSWNYGRDVDHWMCVTHYTYKKYFWSVIHGYGSYGGINVGCDKGGQLLEMMCSAVNHGEPLGFCTADYIWEMMEKI